jgi:hypothetical protein
LLRAFGCKDCSAGHQGDRYGQNKENWKDRGHIADVVVQCKSCRDAATSMVTCIWFKHLLSRRRLSVYICFIATVLLLGCSLRNIQPVKLTAALATQVLTESLVLYELSLSSELSAAFLLCFLQCSTSHDHGTLPLRPIDLAARSRRRHENHYSTRLSMK